MDMKSRSKHIPYTKDELNNEIWKEVQEFNTYAVSNLGRVRNKSTNNVLKGYLDRRGYPRLGLSTKQGNKHRRQHRLVSQAFIPNPENKPQVNHIDGNKQNNRDWNLEWNTNQENTDHAILHGLHPGNESGSELYVKDIDTGIETKYMGIETFAKSLNKTALAIIPYIKHSKEYPFLNKYYIKLSNPEKLGTNYNERVMYVYDVLTKEWNKYNSLIEILYDLGIFNINRNIKSRGFHLSKGYYVTPSKNLNNLSNDIDIDKIKKERDKSRIYKDIQYLLYDYEAKKEYTFKTVVRLTDYINNSLNINITHSGISKAIRRGVDSNTTGLIRGYGVTNIDNNVDWGKFKDSELIASRNGYRINSKVYLKNNTLNEAILVSDHPDMVITEYVD